MLFGTGALAAGYAVSQLSFGTAEATAASADRLVIPGDFPWVDLGDPRDGGAGEAAVEEFARYAGKLAYQRYKLPNAMG